MRLVVDTNILISALLKDGLTRHILMHIPAELLSIHVSKKEVEKYKPYVLGKAKISESEFDIILTTIQGRLILLDDTLIRMHMADAASIMDEIDPDDTPFIAAALATDASIWSDDGHFQKQKRVKVWTTEKLLRQL